MACSLIASIAVSEHVRISSSKGGDRFNVLTCVVRTRMILLSSRLTLLRARGIINTRELASNNIY